jgi:hypothetical protein
MLLEPVCVNAMTIAILSCMPSFLAPQPSSTASDVSVLDDVLTTSKDTGIPQDVKVLRTTPEQLQSIDPNMVDVVLVIMAETPTSTPRWPNSVPEGLPMVVVAPNPAMAALLLRRHSIHEIVAVQAARQQLAEALNRAHGSRLLFRTAKALQTVSRFPPALRRWMLDALKAVPPFAFVSDSVANASTIDKSWSRYIGRSNPKQFLRWILLVRFANISVRQMPLNRMASELGVTTGIINRATKALLGVRWSDAAGWNVGTIHQKFEKYIATTVLPPA